jgi:hypothetical protein
MGHARAMRLCPDSGFSPSGTGSKPTLGAAPAGAVGTIGPDGQEVRPKIQQFAQALGAKNREDNWKRKPNANGTGATHVKSFHCKLADDSLAFMDQQINSWLDEHPEVEVKFVTSSIGEWQGKIKEPGLIVNVWI